MVEHRIVKRWHVQTTKEKLFQIYVEHFNNNKKNRNESQGKRNYKNIKLEYNRERALSKALIYFIF